MSTSPAKSPLQVAATCLLVSGLLTFLATLISQYEAIQYLLGVVTVVLWANCLVLWAVDRQRVPPAPDRDDWA